MSRVIVRKRSPYEQFDVAGACSAQHVYFYPCFQCRSKRNWKHLNTSLMILLYILLLYIIRLRLSDSNNDTLAQTLLRRCWCCRDSPGNRGTRCWLWSMSCIACSGHVPGDSSPPRHLERVNAGYDLHTLNKLQLVRGGDQKIFFDIVLRSAYQLYKMSWSDDYGFMRREDTFSYHTWMKVPRVRDSNPLAWKGHFT